MQIKVPVIVVGCKMDLRDDRQSSLEQVMAPLMQEFWEIETCMECSTLKQIQVSFGIAFNLIGIVEKFYPKSKPSSALYGTFLILDLSVLKLTKLNISFPGGLFLRNAYLTYSIYPS